jgi:hypothetical protein
MATQQAPEQGSVAGKTVNIISFMFLSGVEDNRAVDRLSVENRDQTMHLRMD